MPTGSRPTTPNVAEVKMEFKQAEQYLYNTHHFYDDAGWDEGRLNNLGTAIYNWYDTQLTELQSASAQLTAITCRDLSSGSGLETSVTTGLPRSGSRPTVAAPNNVTIAIKKSSGRSGRAYHGRTFFIGLCNEDIVGNYLTSTALNNIRDAYDALRNPGSGLFAPQLCILSEVLAGNWRVGGLSTICTGISVDSTLDSQRRRLPGRGR